MRVFASLRPGIQRTYIYIAIAVCIVLRCVDGGACGDLTQEMAAFGTHFNISTSLAVGSVVFNMTFPVTLANVEAVEIFDDFETFKVRQIDSRKWYLETVNCIEIDKKWTVEFQVTISGTPCRNIQPVQFESVPTSPVFLQSITDESELDLGDCKQGRILDVYDLSSAIMHTGPCISFDCSVKSESSDKSFWVKNGTFIQTDADCVYYDQSYELKIRCTERGANQSYSEEKNIEIVFSKGDACTESKILDVTSSTTEATSATAGSACTTVKPGESLKQEPKEFFDTTATFAVLYSFIGNLIGAGTVVAIHFLSGKLCKKPREIARVNSEE